MSPDLTQWIAEVRTLQRQLADTQEERDQAFKSTANWRRLYETEARQRREEAAEFQAQIEAIQQRLAATPGAVLEKDLSTVNSLQGLQQRLDGLVQQCEDLAERLQAEQAAHAQTRQTLTAALGDTFNALR